jgi:signal transduction histidine kinase
MEQPTDKPFEQREAYLARLVATSHDPLLVLDREGLVREVNERLCRLLNLPAESIRGRLIGELLTAREWSELREKIAHALDEPGAIGAGELGLIGVDPVPVTLRYTLLALGEAGELVALSGRPLQEIVKLTRDLALLNAELSQSNRSLARSHDDLAQERSHLRLLFDLSRTLSQSLDLEQVLADVLRITKAAFDAEAAGLLLLDDEGRPARWMALPPQPAPDEALLDDALAHGAEGRALRAHQVQRIADVRFERPTVPQLLPGLALMAAPLFTEAGPLGALTLSHRREGFFEIRQELVLFTAAETSALAISNAQLYTALREAEAARERMTSLLVHDIRSPLMATSAGIQIVLRALRGRELPEYVAESLDSGLRSIRSVVELTDQLLEIKRLQARAYPLDEQALSLHGLFAEVVALLQPSAEQRDVRLVASVEPGQLSSHGDRRLLQRVLLNLVSNALRFTPAQGQVLLRARPASAGGVLLAVEDEGPGVPEADRQRIFLPFAQGAGEAHRGTGLGLAFCREVIEAHGGRIWVEARTGGGSRFCVSLPARDERRP